MAKCTVGTRGSGLALRQATEVLGRLKAVFPKVAFDRLVIRTTGDERTDVPLAAVGTEGVFVRELERALTRGEIDLAVHSLKDLPTALTPGLILAAYLQRADARDALVARNSGGLMDLPDGALIGTGSLRRRAQLAILNPRWRFADIRGNLETRLAKMDDGQYDAIVLATAGLVRLGLGDRISQSLPFSAMLPAPGQGAIAIQIRSDDDRARAMVLLLDDAPTRAAVLAERALLRTVEGGCQVPLGAHAEVVGDQLVLQAVLSSMDGKEVVRGHLEGPIAKPEELGNALGLDLLARGGAEILAGARPE